MSKATTTTAPAALAEQGGQERTNVWTRSDYSRPVTYGLDALRTGEKTFYRAWAQAGGGADWFEESAIFEAFDAADAATHLGWNPLLPVARDKLIGDAAVARAQMRADQAAPSDMEKIARRLYERAMEAFDAFSREEEERRRLAIDDEAALKAFKHWLRGAELVLKSNDKQAKELLRNLFGAK